MKRFAVVLALCCITAACGTQVNVFGHTVHEGKSRQEPPPPEEIDEESAAASEPATGVVQPAIVRDVLLALNATVKKQVANDRAFDTEALLASITAELRSRGQMGAEDSTSGTPIDILIDGYTLRSGSHAATLSGLVRVLDSADRERRSFKVLAEATLQVPAQGAEAATLEPLYRRFAALTAEGLAAEGQSKK